MLALYTQYFPLTPMCVSTVYSVLSRALWKKSQAYYSGGIRTHDLCSSLLSNVIYPMFFRTPRVGSRQTRDPVGPVDEEAESIWKQMEEITEESTQAKRKVNAETKTAVKRKAPPETWGVRLMTILNTGLILLSHLRARYYFLSKWKFVLEKFKRSPYIW